MKKELALDVLRKHYIHKLIASRTSVDDLMPLFVKAKGIFDLGCASGRKKKRG